MIRLATIGTSGITERFADAVADVDGIRIDVAYSRDAARARAFADRLGIAGATTDLAALLRSGEIDAVYVGSPNGAHAAQVRDAIDAGIHVFVEKPATPTAGEFADLVGAARDRGVVVFEGMRNVYDPDGAGRRPPAADRARAARLVRAVAVLRALRPRPHRRDAEHLRPGARRRCAVRPRRVPPERRRAPVRRPGIRHGIDRRRRDGRGRAGAASSRIRSSWRRCRSRRSGSRTGRTRSRANSARSRSTRSPGRARSP
jgi:hypothetical protein